MNEKHMEKQEKALRLFLSGVSAEKVAEEADMTPGGVYSLADNPRYIIFADCGSFLRFNIADHGAKFCYACGKPLRRQERRQRRTK